VPIGSNELVVPGRALLEGAVEDGSLVMEYLGFGDSSEAPALARILLCT
jgi:hypothetical protein